MSALNSIEIDRILRRFLPKQILYGGAKALNHVPLTIRAVPFLIIVNTSKSHITEGHWVVLYIRQDRKSFFFCSYGTGIFGRIKQLADNYSNKIYFNRFVIQMPSSETCGYHAIHVGLELCKKIKFGVIMSRYSNNLKENDIKAVKYVNMLRKRATA